MFLELADSSGNTYGLPSPLPYRVGIGAPIARVSPGFIGLGSLTTSEPVVAGGVVTVPRSRRIPIFPLVSVGDGVVGLTRGEVVGLTRGSVVGFTRGTD